MVDIPYDAVADVPLAEVPDVELYHPKSWWTRYVFSQDAKVIAVQYALTASAIGLVALALSWICDCNWDFPAHSPLSIRTNTSSSSPCTA